MSTDVYTKNKNSLLKRYPQRKLLAGHMGYRINMAFLSTLAHGCFTEVGYGEAASVNLNVGWCSKIHKRGLKSPLVQRWWSCIARGFLHERDEISRFMGCELLTSSACCSVILKQAAFESIISYGLANLSKPISPSISLWSRACPRKVSCALMARATRTKGTLLMQRFSSCIRSSIWWYKLNIFNTNISPILFSTLSLSTWARACWYSRTPTGGNWVIQRNAGRRCIFGQHVIAGYRC